MSWKSVPLSLLLAALFVFGASAQTYPNRQITLLLGFPPGGGTDPPSRIIAEQLRTRLGVPVVVENRPGGNQMVAIRALMAAPPDGYTLLVGTGSSLAQNPALNPGLGYDPLNDFTLIARFGQSSSIIVAGPSVPATTLQDLVAHARANPGKLTYASGGVGAAGHLSMELFSQKLGLQMEHVSYKGDGPAILDISEGRVDVMMASVATLQPVLGKVRLLATTARQRLSYAPDVPTLAEAGLPDLAIIDPYTFFGIVGPQKLPKAIVDRLSQAVNEATRSPEVAAMFRERLFTEPVTEDPEAFRAYVTQQLAKWQPFAGQIKPPN